MTRRLRFASFTLVAAISAISNPLNAETLLEIYQQALTNDYQFRAAQAQYEAGQENKNIGRAGLLPQLQGEANWYKSDVEETRTQLDNSTNDSEYDRENTDWSLSLNQALIDFNAWSGYQQGKALASVAEAQLASAREALILRTAEAYFEALKAVDTLETAVAEENALEHQLEQTQQRFEVGLTAITEVHEAKAAYDSSTANRLVAEGNLGIRFEALEVLTGRNYRSLAPLKDEFPVQPPEPLEREQWVAFARENNTNLQTAFYRMEEAEAFADAQKARHYPTLYGSVSYGNTEISYDGAPENILFRDNEEQATTYGVTLSVPLYQGGGISANRRQAYSQYLATQALYNQTQRDVIQSVRASHLGVLTSAATVRARLQAITSNQSALEATQAGYDVGTRDLVDVLNAQRNLYGAQRDYYDALYAYILASFQLRQAAGILDAEDIEQLNQWLDKTRSVDYQPS